MKLTLLKWHPYTNRQLDIKTTLSGYKNGRSEGQYWKSFININFNRNDGIDTTQTINYPVGMSDNYEYDYVIVSSDDTESTTSNDVISRWYIIESKWNRKMQRVLTLKRDVLAEVWNSIQGDDMFVEKGCVPTSNNLIYNIESIQTNKKRYQDSTKLSIASDSQNGYIVGFIANNTPEVIIPSSANVEIYDSLHDLPIYGDYRASQIGRLIKTPEDYMIQFSMSTEASQPGYYREIDIQPTFTSVLPKSGTRRCNYCSTGSRTEWINAIQGYTVDPQKHFYDLTDKYTIASNDISSYNGKKILDRSTSKIYNISVTEGSLTWEYLRNGTDTETMFDEIAQDICGLMNDAGLVAGQSSSITWSTRNDFERSFQFKHITVSITQATDSYYTFPTQTLNASADVPYNMFYCAASTANIKFWSYATKYLGSYLYDMQLVPYRPTARATSPSSFTINNITCYYIQSPNYTTNITVSNPSYKASTAGDYKLWYKRTSNTDLFRFVAPDHSSVYEVSPRQAGIDGTTFIFSVNTTLKPQNTQIYGRIVGLDKLYDNTILEDNTGLIYNGSFSLPRVNDDWVQYQINNKSYADSFERQIENMNKTQEYAMTESGISAIVSAVGTGAALGMLNTVAGLAAGGASLAGGIADQFIAQSRFNESLDYTKDMYGFNLENIKARPNTLTTSGALSCLNHIFIRFEYYSCTTEEETAFNNKIKYDGMTIGAIMQVSTIVANKDNNATNFIKGYITAFNTLQEDAHFLDAVQQALIKGVYIE